MLMKKNLIIIYLVSVSICVITLVTCTQPKKEMVVSTGDVTNVLSNSAEVTGTVIDLGEGATRQGHCYAKTPGVTVSSSKTDIITSGLGNFTSQLTNLEPGTVYYFKAYLSNGTETVYGEERNFTTVSASVPTITTTAITSISTTSATSGGNITSDGGSPVISRGVCWSTVANPTIADSKTADGTGTGIFSSSLTGLIAMTTYHVRAYATNSIGTAYGSDVTFTTQTIVVPTVTTTSASAVTTTTANSGGNVSDGGGATVTARGVCWSTTANPTIADTKTSDGTGTGIFTSSLTGLIPATTYHLRAYATNSAGTAYGSDISFTTTAIVIPTLTTTAVTAITTTTATSGGNVTSDGGASVTAKGVCWSTTANPTITDTKTSNGTGTGVFSSSITGLAAATTYHVRAYATNSAGTSYGADITFTTPAIVLPNVTTASMSSIATTTATSGGNVTSDGGSPVTAKGVCWGATANPTIADAKTSDGTGTGAFVSNLTGLTATTTYHVRAYATNSAGTAYGTEVTFTTQALAVATVTTTSVSGITATTVNSGGNVTSDGGSIVTARGVCWGTTSNPTTAGSKTTDGAGTGSFVSALTGLAPVTTYHVRAYAINSIGTSYGSDVAFTTTAVAIPTLTTTAVSAIAATSATSGGNITTDGGATVTSRGVCWSTTQNPTVADNKIVEGSGIGLFTCSITGLEPGTTYYVRSFATNLLGTAYGTQVSFITLKSLPSVTTKDITDISAMGGTSGGIISSTGGGTISAKGICFGESPNPTLIDNVISSGTGPSSFNSSIVSATPNTLYYVRSYATNEIGTSYGSQKTFTTLNAVFYGFESGTMPVGFSGQWYIANSGYYSSYSIRSLYALSCSFTMTSTYSNSGVIRFSYKLSDYGCGSTSYYPTIKFYIDDVEQNTYAGDANQSWTNAVVNVPSGTHVFKWLFTQGRYLGNPYCGNGADMGTGFVDNIYLIY
jgi:hypothetical protein